MKENRVVITGIGMLTASGQRDLTWGDVRDGRSRVERFRAGEIEFIGARVKNGGEKRVCLKDIFKAALNEAVSDSGIKKNGNSAGKIYSTVSVSKPDFSSYLMYGNFSDMFNSASVHAVISEMGIDCEQVNISAACSTGVFSLINAFKIVVSGEADICLAGSGETPFNELYYSGFKNMGVLAPGECPEEAMKPYDSNRKGFVLGEGACVLVLEEFDHAVKRGARVYAEVSGGELSFDPRGVFRFSKDSMALTGALSRLRVKAGIKPEDGVYINSHGTATSSNDIMETNSFKRVFGEDARYLRISSTKPVTGHLLGGSGAVGTAVAAMALREQYVPPTVNLKDGDPECDLDYVPGKGYGCKLEHSVAVSMGFGGHIGVLGLRRI